MAAKTPHQQAQLPLSNKQVAEIELGDLDLDPKNPRFGSVVGPAKTQTEILDTIVTEYGVEDVISSLAVNGYFPGEPLICIKKKNGNRYVVVEGNRRLAACLVLAGDERAKNQTKRTHTFQELQQAHNRAPILTVPVIWYEEDESPKELISYLGVRHLAASLPWDSYAKAAWIAQVITDGQLSLDDISRMTGDQHRTISRLLHGFYVVGQLVERGLFNPEAAIKKGRGSNADFAFSWVYTLLGYPAARARLGIAETPQPNPIPDSRLDDAKQVFTRLLGNKEMGKAGLPAIEDSREIGDYAAALVDDTKFRLIVKGYTLEDIENELQPTHQRISEGLDDIERSMAEIITLISKEPPSSGDAAKNLPQVAKIANLANSIQKAFITALTPQVEE